LGALISQFLDTNILLYAFGTDPRGETARELLNQGGIIAVQNLNEFVNVAKRKHGRDWQFIREAIATLCTLCTVIEHAAIETHETALALAERHNFNIHDAMLLAIALDRGCDTFLSEDLHNGLKIKDRLTIRNPFRNSETI
jgi:predicted nucleic acid-binding protein